MRRAAAIALCLGLAACPRAGRVRLGERPLSSARFDGARLPEPAGGRPLVVVFFASWSVASAPLVAGLQRLTERAPVDVWGVALDVDQSFVGPFLAKAGARFPVVADPGARVATRQLGVESVPSAVVFAPSGAARAVLQGPREATLEAIEAALAPAPAAPP